MTEPLKCRRCGKQAKNPQWIPIDGTTYVVSVCQECFKYINGNYVAYERFMYLEKSKKKEATEEIKMTNKQGRPSSWTREEVKDLIKMRENGVTVAEMARRLGRTEGAVSGKLWQLKNQGIPLNKVDSTVPEDNGQSGTPVPTGEVAPAEEKGELNPLEQEMANTITQQREEIEKLTARIAELEASNKKLEREKDELFDKGVILHNRASDLDRELQDTRAALAETERQFDEYRKLEHAGADAILARYEKELERTEAEISRLTRALERANRIALGVVERFALEETV